MTFLTSSNMQGDHMVIAVGWGTQNGVDYWLLKNSWGSLVGDEGYVRLKRQTCGANYLCSGFAVEKTPICSKTTPCKTGEGHCDTNESCLSGNCGLKNCPSVDYCPYLYQPGIPDTNCCFEGTYFFFFLTRYSHTTMKISYDLVKVKKLLSKNYWFTHIGKNRSPFFDMLVLLDSRRHIMKKNVLRSFKRVPT